jgi:hypothetical protein
MGREIPQKTTDFSNWSAPRFWGGSVVKSVPTASSTQRSFEVSTCRHRHKLFDSSDYDALANPLVVAVQTTSLIAPNLIVLLHGPFPCGGPAHFLAPLN